MISGLALVTGMVLQDGGRIFSWADDHAGISTKTERAIQSSVDRAIDRGFDKMQVVGSDGREIAIPADTKHALGEAIGRLAKAEAHLAILGIRDGSDEELQAAKVRRDQARTEVETLKAQIEQQKDVAAGERDAVRAQIQDQVREDIRATVRDAVRN
jgi:hypothetical protein